MAKSRVTISLDPELAADVQRLVDEGHSDSLSSWVSEAIRQRHDRDMRIAKLGELVSDYEAEFGEITEAEMAEQIAKDTRFRQPVADVH